MRRFAVAFALIAAPAAAQPMPAGAPPVVMPPPVAHAPMPPMAHSPMPGAPHIRPGFGYRLPPAWRTPRFFVGNWGGYGLPAPAWGFGWSRYYDDAVLTDRWGRVYAVRDVDWDGPRHHRHGRHRRGDGGVYAYDGRWDGAWKGDAYVGTWTGEVRPHWVEDGPPPPGEVGYDAGGCDCGCACATVTTTITQPTMVLKKTRVVTYETVREVRRERSRPAKRVPLGKRVPL